MSRQALKRAGVLRLQRQPQVLVDGQALEQVGDLERAREAQLADAVRAGGPRSRCRAGARVPASGANRPETRLKVVVLPAPLGPISAWICAAIARRATTPRTARMPPKRLQTPRPRAPAPARLGLQESRQRQAFVDLALAHRRRLLGRRDASGAAACAQMPVRPRGREDDEADEDAGRTTAASCRSRSRTARGTAGRTARRAPGPRKLRMPPMTTIASSSPEKATVVDSAAPGGAGTPAARRPAPVTVADSTKARELVALGVVALEGARAARSRGSPPARGRTASASRAAARQHGEADQRRRGRSSRGGRRGRTGRACRAPCRRGRPRRR